MVYGENSASRENLFCFEQKGTSFSSRCIKLKVFIKCECLLTLKKDEGLMSGFKTPWEYNDFAKAVRKKGRFIHSPTVKAFLDVVCRGSQDRKIVIPAGKVFSRAQTGCKKQWRDDGTGRRWMDEIPYSPKRMIPLPRNAREGRINPRGIAYLYLATDHKTAISEVRPAAGMRVTVAKFRTTKQMTVVNLTAETPEQGLPATGFLWYASVMQRRGKVSQEEIDGSVWAQIDIAFSKPVGPDDEHLNYVPTQIIAELIASENYDGIIYRSGLNEDGFNLALFDVNSAEFLQAQVFRVDRVDYDAHESGNPWFEKDGAYVTLEITDTRTDDGDMPRK